MSTKIQYLLFAIVLFVVIVISLGCSCYNIQPYYRDTLFVNQYPYEGFDLKPSKFNVNGNVRPSENAMIQNVHPMLSGNIMIGGNPDVTGNIKSLPVEGFQGLLSAPYADAKPIDTFSQAVGGLECKSYGYTNSKGPLCLDASQIKLLSTRGGNATGVDSQIGPQ